MKAKALYKIVGGVYEGFGPAGLHGQDFTEEKNFEVKDVIEAIRMAISFPRELSLKYLPNQSGFCTVILERICLENESIDVLEEIKTHFPEDACSTIRDCFLGGRYTFRRLFMDYPLADENYWKFFDEIRKTKSPEKRAELFEQVEQIRRRYL